MNNRASSHMSDHLQPRVHYNSNNSFKPIMPNNTMDRKHEWIRSAEPNRYQLNEEFSNENAISSSQYLDANLLYNEDKIPISGGIKDPEDFNITDGPNLDSEIGRHYTTNRAGGEKTAKHKGRRMSKRGKSGTRAKKKSNIIASMISIPNGYIDDFQRRVYEGPKSKLERTQTNRSGSSGDSRISGRKPRSIKGNLFSFFCCNNDNDYHRGYTASTRPPMKPMRQPRPPNALHDGLSNAMMGSSEPPQRLETVDLHNNPFISASTNNYNTTTT